MSDFLTVTSLTSHPNGAHKSVEQAVDVLFTFTAEGDPANLIQNIWLDSVVFDHCIQSLEVLTMSYFCISWRSVPSRGVFVCMIWCMVVSVMCECC